MSTCKKELLYVARNKSKSNCSERDASRVVIYKIPINMFGSDQAMTQFYWMPQVGLMRVWHWRLFDLYFLLWKRTCKTKQCCLFLFKRDNLGGVCYQPQYSANMEFKTYFVSL